MSTHHANLELITIEWLRAMRDRDFSRLAELLDADVEQRWVVDGEVYCSNREQLLEWWSRRPARLEHRIDAIELAATSDHVAMAVRGPDLGQVGGENMGGQVSQLFTLRDGRVTAIRQYLTRGETLAAAGLGEVDTAWR